jgi:hypothetical protein
MSKLESELLSKMAGKIFAPIANSRSSNISVALLKADQILQETRQTGSDDSDVALLGEIAATIFSAGDGPRSDDPQHVKDAVDWGIKIHSAANQKV